MLHGILTSAALLAFIGGWIWAWSPRRREAFDAAARLALEEDQPEAPTC